MPFLSTFGGGSSKSFGLARGRSQYKIQRSLRFNSADSAYLNRTLSAGSSTQWTLSAWCKVSGLGNERTFLNGGDGTQTNTTNDYIGFNTNDQIIFARTGGVGGNWVRTFSPIYRDLSAWYHFVLVSDLGNGTVADRLQLYVNGVRVTAYTDSATVPNTSWPYLNGAYTHNIGRLNAGAGPYYSNFYLTEVNFIDGQALTPSSFGEINPDTGVWSPKKYSGTYGTNGFYLDFSDTSSNTSSTLGKDRSGNNNDWTPNSFSVAAGAGNDSLLDTPTPYGVDTGVGGEVRANYATLNPIRNSSSGITFSNGNLDALVGGNATYRNASATIILPSSGLWYWEATPTGVTGNPLVGVGDVTQADSVWNSDTTVNSNFWYFSGSSGNKTNGDGGGTAYGSSVTGGTVIGIAFDATNGKIWFRGSSTWYASGDPVAGTNAAFSSGLTGKLLSPAFFGGSASSGGTTWSINFGQRPFAYAAPAGFKALCTTNLP